MREWKVVVESPVVGVVSRFMLWIDGIGGYLVCAGRTITLGAPGEANVEVPIMADISRRHATIRRDGEHYLIDPLRPCFIDGRTIGESARLGTSAELGLGADWNAAVRLRFRLPHAASLSARLDLESGHRFRPHADGVVLLADTCLVGPAKVCHVVAPGADRTHVLCRRADGTIVFRTSGSYDVDGRKAVETSVVTRSSRIAGDDFLWQLEPLE
jgi:hypothetical protein